MKTGNLSDKAEVSSVASAQPKVKLGDTRADFLFKNDLLYSLMLESHNDSAVAIAECIAGNVDKFADMMNKKASQLGCNSTYFITPNGLDGQDENGIHHTDGRRVGEDNEILHYGISAKGKIFRNHTGRCVYIYPIAKEKKVIPV